MKISKALRLRLEYALRNAERTYRYIHDPKLAIAKRDTQATTTLHYSRADGAVLYELAKHSSDIVGIEGTIAELRSLLAL